MVMSAVKYFTNYFNSLIYLQTLISNKNLLHILKFEIWNLVHALVLGIFPPSLQTNYDIIPWFTKEIIPTHISLQVHRIPFSSYVSTLYKHWLQCSVNCLPILVLSSTFLISFQTLTFWRRNYFFNFSTLCI